VQHIGKLCSAALLEARERGDLPTAVITPAAVMFVVVKYGKASL
jgi:hypothetical protein